MTLRDWLTAYPLNQGSMSSPEWTAEYQRFLAALKKFWKSEGVKVEWGK